MSITLNQIDTKMKKMINSFVFIDLETTDLIRGKIMPKITELAMVAITREHLQTPQAKLPRLLSKIVIPINPTIYIPKIVSNITELTNQHFKDIKPFDSDVCGGVQYFIRRLKEPICFVAHNGKKFDFPILLHEFQSHDEDMPSDILAIDSIDVFRHYFKEKPYSEEKKEIEENKQIGENKETEESKQKEESLKFAENWDHLLKDSWDTAIGSALDSIEKSESFEEITILENGQNFDNNKEMYMDIQRANDKTPELKILKVESISNMSFDSITGKVPSYKKPENLKLGTIFKSMTGLSAENEHNAESDCLNLIRCANLIGDNFIEFADIQAKPLITYERRIKS